MKPLPLKHCIMTQTSNPTPNPWEARALDYHFPNQPLQPSSSNSQPNHNGQWRQTQDPVIYPGLYSASGFDILNLLFQVISRPNPKIELGPVDSSVALILCDLESADTPIVYVNDSFCQLTGYARSEVIGRNCRFLQTPPNLSQHHSAIPVADQMVLHRLSQAVKAREEIQLQVVNYKKNGRRFVNILSIIPVELGPSGYRYAVGFQVEAE
ncbi:vivid PAS protein VVD [Stachybotrys elegans]|uniref:Vivid PAS protein VVD n=1 Tax=Stachybotrys elegans TaxID=80388 RepID=A0A8K0STN6_9HYPO|nr:vivid PAS protein VVD [Stachybotrys elegans]